MHARRCLLEAIEAICATLRVEKVSDLEGGFPSKRSLPHAYRLSAVLSEYHRFPIFLFLTQILGVLC